MGVISAAGTVGALGTDVETLADALALAEAGGYTGAGGAGACARLIVIPGTAVAAAEDACTHLAHSDDASQVPWHLAY